MVAMHWATSVRRPTRRARRCTAEACSGRRCASTRAMVCGSSPSSSVTSWPGSASSRNSNGLPAIEEASRSMTPAALSAPKEASSSPAAKSRAAAGVPAAPDRQSWNSSRRSSATVGVHPAQPHDLGGDLLGLGLAELLHDLGGRGPGPCCISTTAAFWVPVRASVTSAHARSALSSMRPRRKLGGLVRVAARPARRSRRACGSCRSARRQRPRGPVGRQRRASATDGSARRRRASAAAPPRSARVAQLAQVDRLRGSGGGDQRRSSDRGPGAGAMPAGDDRGADQRRAARGGLGGLPAAASGLGGRRRAGCVERHDLDGDGRRGRRRCRPRW